ncbi:DUF6221 family protein [Actinopolymorpha pittospori]|uniref:Uncharacterized protein n=1 Tax=Actinopolymorpha pittospori TaxID=648752 RepID=A0A927MU05_9ACTN|nr:hypothetical protein [Actinopolymorpha pittospori]
MIDDFILKRLAEDEQSARRRYQQDYNPVDLERALGTCRARRQVVNIYRILKDRPHGDICLLMILVIAELYEDHPDYQEEWRLAHAKLPHPDDV